MFLEIFNKIHFPKSVLSSKFEFAFKLLFHGYLMEQYSSNFGTYPYNTRPLKLFIFYDILECFMTDESTVPMNSKALKIFNLIF